MSKSIVEVSLFDLIPSDVPERDQYRGAKLRLRRVPPAVARSWSMRQRKIYLDNKRRRLEANASTPGMYDDDGLTEEAIEEANALEQEILDAAVDGITGVDGANDHDGALAELAYIGIETEAAGEAQAAQSLTARQRFRAASARVGGPAADAE